MANPARSPDYGLSHLRDILHQPGERIVDECDLFRLFTEPDADALGGIARFLDLILTERHLFGAALHVDRDAIGGAAVLDDVLLDDVAVAAERRTSLGAE